ncbi:carbohydrate kinase [Defluviimonas sp. D31]|uniref:carbohydrate kinase family protein n=1 Tax=Defluviimonas sp. D31 TaxID=3083253 RepID=UPI00296EBD35|nr:carbohydrate kinase [Defluviimonas sp. D31]MDW4548246.1 carbohydrate kinase [Defluviimonas sp. D31]
MILCCGEALVDMIPEPTVGGREGFVPHPGGAVFNTAIALGRLGVKTGMFTGLSTDMFGQQLKTALEASHVDTSRVVTSDRPTTLAFVHLAGGQASYSFFDENSAGRMLTPDVLPALPDEVSALFFGGISLASEPAADAYAAFLARGRGGRAVMLDPNIRPGFIRDVARYRARLDGMIRLADIVKVSDEDLNWIVPEPQSVREKVDAILAKGPSLVVLTRGGDGATGFLAGGGTVYAPAIRVRVVDTVGAGDTFNAGLLARLSELGLLRNADLKTLHPASLEQALAHGARVAAFTVSRSGANPPWAEELVPNPGTGEPGG